MVNVMSILRWSNTKILPKLCVITKLVTLIKLNAEMQSTRSRVQNTMKHTSEKAKKLILPTSSHGTHD